MFSPSLDKSASNHTDPASPADTRTGDPQEITQESASPSPLVSRDIIVIGASAGGVEALSELVRDLPADLPASVFVVLHVPRHGTSVLSAILARRGHLPARIPEDGEKMAHGVIYVAPPDYHMVLEHGRVRLVRGPSENSHRPAIDPLFRSAAKLGGARVIGVVLSGMLDDGTAGLLVIKRHGGTALVQEPTDALFSGMPSSALMNVPVDYAVPLREMGGLICRLVAAPVAAAPAPFPVFADDAPDTGSNPSNSPQTAGTKEPFSVNNNHFASDEAIEQRALREEVAASLMEPDMLDREIQPGATPSVYSCPECTGVLWEVKNEGIIRFRCRTGHAYSADSLLASQSDALEAALWTALRALEESASLSRRLYARAQERGHRLAVARFAQQARESDERAKVIRQVLVTGKAHPTESSDRHDAEAEAAAAWEAVRHE